MTCLFRYCRTRDTNVKQLPGSYRLIPSHSFGFCYIRNRLGYRLSVINPAFVLASRDKRHRGHQLRTLASVRSPKWNYERFLVDMPQVARKWQSTWISPAKGQFLTQEIKVIKHFQIYYLVLFEYIFFLIRKYIYLNIILICILKNYLNYLILSVIFSVKVKKIRHKI